MRFTRAVNWKYCLRDCWIGRTPDAATRQFLFLFFCGDDYASRCHKRRLRWCQNSQIVILLMNIVTGSLRLNSALKPSIISAIWCIRNAEIVDSLVGPIVNSVRWKIAMSKLITGGKCLLLVEVVVVFMRFIEKIMDRQTNKKLEYEYKQTDIHMRLQLIDFYVYEITWLMFDPTSKCWFIFQTHIQTDRR